MITIYCVISSDAFEFIDIMVKEKIYQFIFIGNERQVVSLITLKCNECPSQI